MELLSEDHTQHSVNLLNPGPSFQPLPLITSAASSSSDTNNNPSSSGVNLTTNSNTVANLSLLASQNDFRSVVGPSMVHLSEPLLKRLKTESLPAHLPLHQQGEKLERRLGESRNDVIGKMCNPFAGSILGCSICMDLPKSSVVQCTNGHLMCSACFTHCLADARLKDETATCPMCRCVITRDICSRNLAVEKAVSELPGSCRFCEKELPRSMLNNHEEETCEERIVGCSFSRIGCPWKGPFHEIGTHEIYCPHPNKSGREVLESLDILDRQAKEEKKLYDSIFDLLSFEKITFHDLQFKGYRTEEFIHRLYYETARFTSFNNQWVVKARVNENEKDPSQVCERRLSYQLVLKSKLQSPLAIHYLILKGPFGDMKVNPRLNRFEFNESVTESPYINLPLVDPTECNKLLASKAINFRLIIFQMPK